MGRTLTLGFVQRPHGVRGLVRVRLDLEDTSWLVPGVELLVGSTPRELSRFGPAPGGPPSYLIGLLGVGDRSAAEALKGESIAVARGALPDLDDDDGYYVTDLVGLSAEQSDGRRLGTVHDVFTLAGRLMARLDDGLVPLDGPVIAHVDFEAGVVTFDLPEGLFEAQR